MILLVTNARDLTTDFVVREQDRRGEPYYRLNTERLADAAVSFGVDSDEDWSITQAGRTIRGADVTAAYFRRPEPAEIPDAVSDPRERAYCTAEWGALLKTLLGRLGPRWLNDPAAIALAEDKPRQLVLARRLGFEVPETLITNDPEAFEAFLAGPTAVGKPLRHARLDGDEDAVIFTSRLDQAEARDAAAIAAAPLILQREIEKAADVRVTVVGDRVFAAAIHSQGQSESEVDWRRGDGIDLPHLAIDLPPAIAERCRALVAALGLTFGAIDLVEAPDGRFWFLEINPNGQWAWIETRTGQPITAALVDELLRRRAR
ncbi:MAG: MvdC/MvdD family ATP grasp protein [Phenylobacterium sp.]